MATERYIATGANAGIADLLVRHEIGKNLLLVFDDYTWLAAGKEVAHYLAIANADVTPYPLELEVRATLADANRLAQAAMGFDAFIAVGSGTINDLTKYVAAKMHKPYVCVATAASMNGYCAANASLESEQGKQSYKARPPIAVLADLDVIVAAPRRMTRAGLGDMLCRTTVERDMMLSHFLLGTPYPVEIFKRLRSHESELVAGAGTLSSSNTDPRFYAKLMEALLDAGDAMAEFGSSAVASQGEHMIAHTLEMLCGEDYRKVLHGEMVAVASVTYSKIQQQILNDPPLVKLLPRSPSLFLRVFGNAAAERLEALYKKKQLSEEQVKSINEKIKHGWPDLRQAMQDIALSPETLERTLVIAGLATRPGDLRLDPERYKSAVAHAYLTRDRFTFLDLADMKSAQ